MLLRVCLHIIPCGRFCCLQQLTPGTRSVHQWSPIFNLQLSRVHIFSWLSSDLVRPRVNVSFLHHRKHSHHQHCCHVGTAMATQQHTRYKVAKSSRVCCRPILAISCHPRKIRSLSKCFDYHKNRGSTYLQKGGNNLKLGWWNKTVLKTHIYTIRSVMAFFNQAYARK